MFIDRLYLNEKEAKKATQVQSSNRLFAVRREIQLRQYVQSIREAIHEERKKEKEVRRGKAMAEYVIVVLLFWIILLGLLSRLRNFGKLDSRRWEVMIVP